MQPDYDVLIIGSGFGGSVSALRLTEKGYRVGVLEAGRRFADEEHAKTSWNLRKFLWMPKLGMYGIQRIHLLRNVMILAGAGVGGGSLNYANTLYVPPDPFFNDPQWKHITDWRAELMPHYEQAQRMLGVVQNPTFTDADKMMKEVADDMGVGNTFVATPVGVFFGPDGKKAPGKTVPDPYFGGVGPDRTGCIECGSCMTGCRYGAKNTLLKNYLGLAESAGAQVHPMTTVTSFKQRPDGLWEVKTAHTGRFLRRKRRTFTATNLILAAGTFGTQKLLFKMRDRGNLPKLSDKLGVLTRTNSESIVGAGRLQVRDDLDLTHGVAITSSIHPTSDTHIEPVRYGKGSNAMGLLQTLMTDGAGPERQRRAALAATARPGGSRTPRSMLRMLNPAPLERAHDDRARDAAPRQLDHDLHPQDEARLPHDGQQAGPRRAQPDLDSGRQRGHPPSRAEDRRRRGRHLGRAVQHPADRALPRRRGDRRQPEHGVIDPYQRVYNYPTMYVVDGASISANLGVNPSLSITAQAERAASLWPNKGEDDLRPEQGEAYKRIAPIEPEHPVVPADAFGALRRIPVRTRPDRSAQRVKAPDKGYFLVHAHGIPGTVGGSLRPVGRYVWTGRRRDEARVERPPAGRSRTRRTGHHRP